MDKKQLHHLWTRLRRIKVWHLLVLLIVATTVAVFALRQNNLTMIQLRQEVYTADEKNQDVEAALQRLRAYVHAHMNTNLATGSESVYPPIQLKYTFQRLQDAEKAKAQPDADIYARAQAYCEQQNSSDVSGRNRVPCIEKYVSENGGAKAKTIPDAMYKFDFASPSWSPDLAGFSVVIAVILLILLAARIILGRVLRRLTK